MERERLTRFSREYFIQLAGLFRARELFITLFQDRSPLFTLGYTLSQQDRLLPVLKLIENEGRTHLFSAGVELCFENPRAPEVETANINKFPDDQGFHLSAYIDLGANARLRGSWTHVFSSNLGWFQSCDTQAASIFIFKKDSIQDLDYLAQTVLAYHFCDEKVLKENPFNKTLSVVTEKLGLFKPILFQTTWADERKEQFFILAKIPGLEDQYFAAWKRLAPVADEQGTAYPFAEKPNVSLRTIQEAFKREALVLQRKWAPQGVC